MISEMTLKESEAIDYAQERYKSWDSIIIAKDAYLEGHKTCLEYIQNLIGSEIKDYANLRQYDFSMYIEALENLLALIQKCEKLKIKREFEPGSHQLNE